MVVEHAYRRGYNSGPCHNSRARKMIVPHPSHHPLTWQQQYAHNLNYPRMQVDLQRNTGMVATNTYVHDCNNAVRRTNEVLPTMHESVTNKGFANKSSDGNQPQFHHLYMEFENMKNKGLVTNSHMMSNNVNLAIPNRLCGSPSHETKMGKESDENFADAMKLFMKSYLPSSTFSCAKPVEDWSKEAGNLLQELTDNESQSDLDNSSWKIPSSSYSQYNYESKIVRENGNCMNTSGTEVPNASKERKRVPNYNFDIHRHILEINPSPYPGGSPVSTGQSASNHSSDNDADDEDAKSLNDCSKAIGVRKNLKKKLNTSFISMKDAGYLSSATESDGSRGLQINVKVNSVFDSDDLSSESGFTSSTCSRPASPLSITTSNWHENRQGIGKRRHSLPEHSLSAVTQQKIAFCEFPKNTPINGMSITPLSKGTGVFPPLPPLPPHIPTFISRLPLPPPYFPPAPFHTPASLSPMQSSISNLLPRQISPFSIIHNLSSSPLYKPCQKDIIPAQNSKPTSSSMALDSFGPTDAGIYHKHKAWITDEILEMIAVRDRLYKRMKKHPAPDIVEMYKKVRNMVVGMTRNAKRAYEKQIEDQQIFSHRNDNHTEFTQQIGDAVHLNFMQASW